jgi:hypothetical protein
VLDFVCPCAQAVDEGNTHEDVGSALLGVAGAVALEANAEMTAAIARDAHAIAERTDVPALQVGRVLCALRSWEVRDGE